MFLSSFFLRLLSWRIDGKSTVFVKWFWILQATQSPPVQNVLIHSATPIDALKTIRTHNNNNSQRVNQTHRDGVDEGGNSKRQAAAQQGEDGVAQVVVHRDSQRASGHVDGGLDCDGGLLASWVLLLLLHKSATILRRRSIALQATPEMHNSNSLAGTIKRGFGRVCIELLLGGFTVNWYKTPDVMVAETLTKYAPEIRSLTGISSDWCFQRKWF